MAHTLDRRGDFDNPREPDEFARIDLQLGRLDERLGSDSE
jgi:hypothetical protein